MGPLNQAESANSKQQILGPASEQLHHSDTQHLDAINDSNILDPKGWVDVDNYQNILSRTNTLTSVGASVATMEVAMATQDLAIVARGAKHKYNPFRLAHVVRTSLYPNQTINPKNISSWYVVANAELSIDQTPDSVARTGRTIAMILTHEINNMRNTSAAHTHHSKEERQAATTLTINQGDFMPSDMEMSNLEIDADKHSPHNHKNAYYKAWNEICSFVDAKTIAPDVVTSPTAFALDVSHKLQMLGPTNVGARTMLLNYMATKILNTETDADPQVLLYKMLCLLPCIESFDAPLVSQTAHKLVVYLKSALKSAAMAACIDTYNLNKQELLTQIQEFISKYQFTQEHHLGIMCVKNMSAPSNGLEKLKPVVAALKLEKKSIEWPSWDIDDTMADLL